MISWDRVGQLKEDVGESDFAEIVTLFLEEADEIVGRLAASEDLASILEDLHALKGSALNLGFVELGSICNDQERVARYEGAERVALAPVLASYGRSRIAFLDRVRDGAHVA